MYEMPSTTSAKEVIIDKTVVEGKKKPMVLYLPEKKLNNIKKAS
jgi:ATP-dependent protease Clp ATPase subunit